MPLLDELEVWLRVQAERLSHKSEMGKAVACILTRWDGLILFAEDGQVEMDGNLVENQIRTLALNRKNALFAIQDEGAQNWTRIASLVATCKMNGVEPFAYLKASLRAIAAGHPHADLDDLLPWAVPKTAVKAAARTAPDRAAATEAMGVNRRLRFVLDPIHQMLGLDI
ncbi:transposase [Palleronia aestuarii]|uniref:Transposase n=1 Tax=Palleronia aestuarii TaxID=568105 RepID=A0A2W7NDV3_9RHOB|nr:transposase [Palleronia aestuarii]